MNKDILKYSINDKINYDDKDEIFNNIFENNCFIVDFKEFFKYNKKFILSLVYYCFIKLYNDYFIKNGELITLFNELIHKTLKNRNIKILYLFIHNILLYKIKKNYKINEEDIINNKEILLDGGKLEFDYDDIRTII